MSNYSRYEEGSRNLQKLIDKMKDDKFPIIKQARIKPLLDSKAKKTKGKYRIAELRLADEFIKFFSEMIEDHPYDYVLVIDKALYNKVEKKDIRRVVFHELCHGFKDDNGKYKLVPHDFEGFYDEIPYNEDDPDWNLRLSNEMEILHEEGE